jgi:hypothetical protein
VIVTPAKGKRPMGRNAAQLCLLPAFAMALAACSSTTGQVENPNIYPTGFRQEVLLTLQRVLADPTNVRDAYISDPALTLVGKDQRYTICVRYNPRDELRRYLGSTDRIGYFYEGHINQLVAATKEQCGNAAYKPFPELEKVCPAKKCD